MLVGAGKALTIGGIAFCLSFSTFLYPLKYGYICASLLLGFANAVTWTAQGNYLAMVSDEKSITRNTGILWTISMSSAVFGNLLIVYTFEGKEKINSSTRILTYSILVILGFFGVILSLFLKKFESSKSEDDKIVESPLKGFSTAIKYFTTKTMLLISVIAIFIGLEITFFSGLYSTSIAFTRAFGVDRKKYSGECGLLIGIGEILAGLISMLSSKCKKPGIAILISAYLIYLGTFSCIYVNLPAASTLLETAEPAIFESNLYLALLCAVLLGLCDGLFGTQMNEFISVVYKENSSAPFAIFSSLQSLSGGALFFLSNYIDLHSHLIILATGATLGSIAFCLANAAENKKKLEKTNMEHHGNIEPNNVQKVLEMPSN
ncbi:UNC93-like protein MFSD11 isoform X2 [Tetranychus urticae]|nr:UNC93-like protein MFSD11 isoform X2 [Tetranychus urticae]